MGQVSKLEARSAKFEGWSLKLKTLREADTHPDLRARKSFLFFRARTTGEKLNTRQEENAQPRRGEEKNEKQDAWEKLGMSILDMNWEWRAGAE